MTDNAPTQELGGMASSVRSSHPGTSISSNPINLDNTRELEVMEMGSENRYQSVADMQQANYNAMLPVTTPDGSVPPSIKPKPIKPEGPADPNRRRLLIGGAAVAVLAIGGGVYALTHQGPSGPLVTTPITFDLAFSTEKFAWLQPLIQKFNKQVKLGQRSITINIVDSGSLDVESKILNGTLKPVAWSPASSLELNRLNTDWQNQPGQQNKELIASSGDTVPVSLVSSPLVFAVWSERAAVLRQHYQNGIDWSTLHDALQKRWQDIGGDKNWGVVKFGQTLPTRSNSGLLTITLLAYAATDKQNGLTSGDVKGQVFKSYLDVFERAVFDFGQSSGTYLDKFIVQNGPAQADVICTYENLLLSPTMQQGAKSRWQQSLQIFYPSLNILSDHPFAILQAPWVTDDQKAAAQQFLAFLLQNDQQRWAVQNGFRPSPNANVQIADPTITKNPFVQFASLFPNGSVAQTIQPLAQVPDGGVINDMLGVWKAAYPHPQTANG